MSRTFDSGDAKSTDETPRDLFVRTSWVNVIGNLLKVLVEGTIGVLFGSMALIADAAHSIGDVLGSSAVLIWGRQYYEGPDWNHPHGHERIEPITALFVGTILILIGLKVGYDAVKTLIAGPGVSFSYVLVLGLGFAVIDMIFLYVYTARANQKINSPSLHAMARDSLNDIASSIAAILGVAGVSMGLPVLDPIAGGLVCLLMLFEGGKIGYENLNYLTGAAPSEEKQEEIREIVYAHPEVRGLHDFVTYYIGPVIEVEMHVEVDGDLTVRKAHDIETDLRERVKEIEDVYDVHIHLDPAGIGEWKEGTE